MRKKLTKLFLAAAVAFLLFTPTIAHAGEELGTLSQKTPMLYKIFTIKPGEEHIFFFHVKGTSEKCWFHLENMGGGDSTVSGYLRDKDFNPISSIDLDVGYIGATNGTIELSEDGEWYYVSVSEASFTGMDEIEVGVCVYSEDWGGKQYEFVQPPCGGSGSDGEGACVSDDKSSEKTGLTLSKDTLSIKKGKKSTLKATLTGDLKGTKVKWTSSDPKVAKVSKNGKITAKKYGTAIITCTSKKDPYTIATCTVKVVKKVEKADNKTDTKTDDKSADASTAGDQATSAALSSVTLSEGQGSNMYMTYSYSYGFMTGATRLLTLKSNDYEGEIVLQFSTSNGTDEQTIKVEKNSTYYIDYKYIVKKTADTVIKQPDTQIMIGTDPITGMPRYSTIPGQTTTIPAPTSSINLDVSIKGGKTLKHTESFAGDIKKGSMSYSKQN